MKYFSMFFLWVIFPVTCFFAQNDHKFSIGGTLENSNGKKVYLIARGPATSNLTDFIPLDSSVVTDTHFRLSGDIKESKYLSVVPQDTTVKGWFAFIAEPEHSYTIKENYQQLGKAQLQNNNTNTLIAQLKTELSPLIRYSNSLVDSITSTRKGDSVRSNEFLQKYLSVQGDMNKKEIQFIKENPSNPAALFAFNDLNFEVLTHSDKQELLKLLAFIRIIL